MNAIFINRYFYPDDSATSVLMTDLACSLAEAGWNVEAISSRQKYGQPDVRYAPCETYRGVRIRRLWLPGWGGRGLGARFVVSAFFLSAVFFCLIFSIKKGSVVIAKTDPPLLSVPAAAACRLRSGKLVNWLQDLFPEIAQALGVPALRSGPLPSLLKRMRNASLRAARRNVVIDDRMAAVLASSGAVPAGRLAHIPNWADGSQIIPIPADQNELRKNWGLQNKLVIGYSGNMGRIHDFETIIRAASDPAGAEGVIFLFVGEGAQRAEIERRLAGRPYCIFKPFQPRALLNQSLNVADIHLVTMRPETDGFALPSKAYSILAAGKPVIFIGKTPSTLSELVQNERCGMRVESGDAAGLMKAIAFLQNSPETAREMGRRARLTFEKQFDKKIALGLWKKLLFDLEENN